MTPHTKLEKRAGGYGARARENVVIYAPQSASPVGRKSSDNAQSKLVDGELHHGEAVEEKISLSDRFGLWLSFYPVRAEYLDMVNRAVMRLVAIAAQLGPLIRCSRGSLSIEAPCWALARGVRNGRSAEHFARHWWVSSC